MQFLESLYRDVTARARICDAPGPFGYRDNVMKVIRLQQLMTDGIRQQKSGQFGKKLRRRQGKGWQCWGKGGTARLLPALGHVLAAKQNPRACCPQSPQLRSLPGPPLHRTSPGTGGGDSGNAQGGSGGREPAQWDPGSPSPGTKISKEAALSCPCCLHLQFGTFLGTD